MSTEKSTPPTIAPKVVSPRPESPGRPNVTPPPPPPPEGEAGVDEETVAGMERASGESKVAVARTGAVKAAAAAIAAAKMAKKQATPPRRDEKSAVADPRNEDSVPDQSTSGAPTVGEPPTNPSMHYSVAGITGTSTVLNDPTQVMETPLPADPVAAAPSADIPDATKTPAREEHAPRTVRLAVSKVNPWSVMKLSFLLSVGIGIMAIVATVVFWMILDGMHVFTKADDFLTQVVGDAADVNILQFVEFSRVVSMTTIIVVINIILTTALATIVAFLYNVTAALIGGLHVTLTDD